jgi:tetratricopeptide (TPR) repeat protein
VTGTPSDVKDQLAQGRPIIALLQVGSGAYHYVVLIAWANGGVIIHDPATAPFRTSSEQAFDDAWSRSGRWALLILPPQGGAPVGPDSAASNASTHIAITGCDAIVEDAISKSRNGDTAEAERRLLSAEALCPESAAPLRGLAGLRFKAEDWAGAARLAERALARDPDDHYTWRLLAGSRFLMGDEEGALRAWNQISEPRADLARVDGLARIRYRAVAGQLGLPPGRLLTSRAFLRARRRLAELPAQSEARLSLRPLPQGSAQVNVALLERPLLFDGPLDAGGAGLRALAEREAFLRVGSPTGNGELWTAGYSWRQERPRASLALAVPAPGGSPGIWRVEGFWERQAYAGETPSGPDGAVRPSVRREERRRTALSFADWVTSNLRLEVGAALDKWSGRGAHLSLDGKIEALLAGDRLALRAHVAQWTSLERGAPFEAGGLLARWSTKHLDRGGWLARVGVSTATSEAPLSLWPGASTGRGRAPLLRAHPLLENGVVAGRAFGRTLVHMGLERQAWMYTVKSLRFGWSLFVDGARPWDPLRSARVPWQVDAGAGIRLAGLGTRGEFRITAARGLQDGRSALSVGWEVR